MCARTVVECAPWAKDLNEAMLRRFAPLRSSSMTTAASETGSGLHASATVAKAKDKSPVCSVPAETKANTKAVHATGPHRRKCDLLFMYSTVGGTLSGVGLYRGPSFKNTVKPIPAGLKGRSTGRAMGSTCASNRGFMLSRAGFLAHLTEGQKASQPSLCRSALRIGDVHALWCGRHPTKIPCA